MLKLSLGAICILTVLASCSSSPTPGGPSQTQEFNPTTSRWETTNRVVTPAPAQPATTKVTESASSTATNAQSTAVPAASTETTAKEGLLKRSLKWLPGVD